IPRVFGAGVYQLTVFIDTFCASLSTIVGPGGISAIYYANRIIQFPMGIFTFALASAVLPTLSGLASQNQTEQMKKTIVFALENLFFVLFPTSVMMIIFSTPVIRLLFERGEFDSYSTAITSLALMCSAFGLFSFGGIKILVTAFHALQDTKTPVKVAALCLVINAVLNFILMFPLKVGGIALASSIAATIDFFILFYFLEKRLGRFNSGLRQFVLKVLIASFAAGVATYSAWHFLSFFSELIKFITVGIGGMAFYGIVSIWLRIPQAQKIQEWLLAKNKAL
ncbi:MAG: polysaccharide biosynthesis C-terminal domain-containing protein, partial [Candidatus Omnitrophica bacterium]|nr:polysaccharide biosynthesis C-terminal domain-containing protein [Candidatus Omnitrophota bacterium]